MEKKGLEKILAFTAIVTVIIAGVLGFIRETGDIENDIADIIPEENLAQPIGEKRFIVIDKDTERSTGYISLESAEGYGGEMVVAVLIDTLGTIKDLKVIKHQETPSFFEKVIIKGLFKQLIGASFSQSFEWEADLDIVSGATYTADAITECAKAGSRHIAASELGLEVPVENTPRFTAGIPEFTLILLYIIALIGAYSHFRYKKMLRWITLISGMIVLGFWFSVPLTLSRINLFLMGFWPDWHDNLYWYMLVLGFFLILLVTRKNIYCNWICPLGCVQDGLGLIGGAKSRFSKKINQGMTWIQRSIAWLAIILALYFRNPVKVNYEIFGVSLSLTGTTFLFVLTGIFFIASAFIKRPWCNYLCPVTPVSDLLQMLTRRRIA